MKMIGILGGMSWESSTTYYRTINQAVKQRLGGLASARLILYSYNFDDIESRQRSGAWEELTEIMISGAKSLQAAGADCVIIATNTMHKMADNVAAAIDIPFLHIVDGTAEAIKNANMSRVGLLGTRFTMEEEFYPGRFRNKHGIDIVIPEESDRQLIHDVIFGELCAGKIEMLSREQVLRIINDLAAHGAEGVILGCTEIGLLVKPEDVSVPLFDTTIIHANMAVDWALK
ncbi:aspartate/glutamate racemase family protein [bacterium]|nr:aspartate/glutamate racemase family protein [bacterium]MBU1652819.1 aspartate/glutamate racemase family protein [bacterium]